MVVSVSDVMVKNQYLDDIPDGFKTFNTFRWTANRKCSKYHLKDDKMVHTKNFTFHLATHSNCNFFTVFKSMNMKKLCDRVLFYCTEKLLKIKFVSKKTSILNFLQNAIKIKLFIATISHKLALGKRKLFSLSWHYKCRFPVSCESNA